jgi:branched-subunit amino acid aminotransferase/4-amino-4-deoxychorismate lyase
MGIVQLNDRLSSEETLGALLSNRGFLYGDGFFETMVLRNGRIFFLESHLERALNAMQTLQLHFDKPWDLPRLKALLLQLWQENGSPTEAVFKWIVWRNSDGLYTPNHEEGSHYLLQIKPYRAAPATKAQAYVAKTITNAQTIYSSFKRLSALHYVMAGLEKNNRKADELILMDQYENLSEATSSCLFWIISDILYTPCLTTGCIAGVARKNILKWAATSSIKVEAVKVKVSSLSQESTVFTANVAGISLINRLEKTTFKNNHSLYLQLHKDLFLSTAFSQSL